MPRCASTGHSRRDLAEAYHDISKFFPKLCRAQFSSYIDGLSSYTPDGEIILGSIPGISGFLVASGDCGHGIALSAGIGQTISELISTGKPQIDISKFKPLIKLYDRADIINDIA